MGKNTRNKPSPLHREGGYDWVFCRMGPRGRPPTKWIVWALFFIICLFHHHQDAAIEEVVQSGPGLVYITYPEVVLRLPGGPIWAVTFFVMLVTIGIDSEFCIVESLVTGIVDMWPDYLRYCQVWSLTQFYSVDFSKSRINVKRCVFNKRTIKVCVSCCWWCPGTSAPSEAHLTVSLYLSSSRSNARRKSRVKDGDEGVTGSNGREIYLPNKG